MYRSSECGRRAARFLMLVALLGFLGSASAGVECIKPSHAELISRELADFATRKAYESEFRSQVHRFVDCQRGSLEKRSRGLTPDAVRRLVLDHRESEDRALAEAAGIASCLLAAKDSGTEVAHAKCEELFVSGLRDRRPGGDAQYAAPGSERREHGGIWTYRALDLGRPGHCYDAPCNFMFAVEITNTTPFPLKCDVSLRLSSRDGASHGDQTLVLYPGDSLPAARASIAEAPEVVEPDAACTRAESFVPELTVPASCTLSWHPRRLEYPKGFSRSAWESGVAIVEFATQQGHQPPRAVTVLHEDLPQIGSAARTLVEKQRFSTNCAGQSFRMRVEYRAFPCYPCLFESGVVTMLLDEHRTP